MALELFARYPQLAAVPRVALCDLPTPVEPLLLGDWDARGFGELWVKRDDLTSAVYGGNKVRKLEFLLGGAIAEERPSVLTFGAFGSNHALATAVHARELGLTPHAVLSPQEPGPFAAATLRAHAALGTVIHLAEGWDGAAVAEGAIRRIEAAGGVAPYVIPMGGTNELGALAYAGAVFELAEQVRAAAHHALGGLVTTHETGALGAMPDVVYVAAGTLGTAIGLALGFAATGANTRVQAVRVTPDTVASHNVAERLVADTVALIRAHAPEFPALTLADLAFELREDWFEPGYGVVTSETTEAVATGAAAGLKLETTYTGKAVAAMLADARAGKLAGERVLFWDTYNSAPMPAPGPIDALPPVLQEYVEECDRVFGRR